MTVHSFGGSALDRHLFDFETTIADPGASAVGGDPSPEPAAPAPVAAPAGPPSPETAPPTPAADPFAEYGLSQQDVAEIAELLPMLRQASQMPVEQQQAAAPGGPPEFDPFDPESFARYTEWNNQQLLGQIQQLISPLTAQHETQVYGEAEQRALDILKDDAARNGDFLAESSIKQARLLADSLLPQFQERYGQHPRAAEAALAAAATQQRQHDSAVAQAAVERYKNELATLAGAPREQGVNSAAPPVAGEYKTELEAAAAYMARASQAPNVGV